MQQKIEKVSKELFDELRKDEAMNVQGGGDREKEDIFFKIKQYVVELLNLGQ